MSELKIQSRNCFMHRNKYDGMKAKLSTNFLTLLLLVI